MSRIKLATREDQSAFRPGDEITGAAGWQLDQPPTSIEIRLFWHTEGKGTKDVAVVETLRVDNPAQEGARPFRFIAPESPHSFSGRLVSLLWALELVTEPAKDSARLDLVISPTGREIALGQHESA